MTNPTLTGQDEARRALADRLLTVSDGDLREYARDSLMGIHPDQTELRRWADLMDEAAEMLLAPSLDRGAEEMREACLKAAAGASYGPPSSWPGDFPHGWRHPPGWDEDRTPTPTEAAWHDNGARDAWFAIRALPVPADLNEGGEK